MSDNGLRKDSMAAIPGFTIPGTPAIPAAPAYCHDEVIYHPDGEHTIYIPYPANPLTGRPAGVLPVTVSGPAYSEVVRVCYPAVDPVPGTPAISVPPVEAKFYPGWNAGADSIANLTGSGQYVVSADPAAVGIVTGLTPSPGGTAYLNITHGIYFDSGSYQYIENGVIKSLPAPYSSSDEFVIGRRPDGRVAYSKNGTLEYSSLLLSTGVVFVDAAEYFGGDTIAAAALEAFDGSTGAPGTGTNDPPFPAPGTPFPPGIPGVTPGDPYPPGYTPGTGPVPVPPPGTTLAWNGCNGVLQQLVVWAADTTPNGVGPGAGPPPSGPPGPGGEPAPPLPPDSNGDWPGRIGGAWRMLVGYAEGAGYGSNNGGTVYPGDGTIPTYPTDPSNEHPVDPLTGDWPGRSGGQWPMFVGQAFGSTGAGTDYSTSSNRLPAFVADAGASSHTSSGEPIDGELLTPSYAVCAGTLQAFAGFGVALAGMTGTVQGRLAAFSAFGATIDGGWVNSDGPPPFEPPGAGPTDGWEPNPSTGDWPGRVGGQWTQFVGQAYEASAIITGGSFDGTYTGPYRLLAQGYSPAVINDPVTGFPVGYGFYGLHGGGWTLDAYSGAYFSITGPAGDVVGTGAAAIVGSFDATGPAGSLIVEGTVGIGGGLLGQHFGDWTLAGYGGGVFDVTGPHGTLGSSTGSGTAGGIAGTVGSFAATGPHGYLETTGTSSTGAVGVFDAIGPALQALWGDLFAIGPHGYLVAGGAPTLPVVVTTDTEGYSITLIESDDGVVAAVSRYTQYPFERIVRFGSTYYGITAGGIFQLGGDTFNTAKIVATVAHPPHDFPGRGKDRAQNLKNMRSILLAGHIPASLVVSVAVDDDGTTETAYDYTPQPTNTARNHRVDVGRGLEGRYIQMRFTNPDGKDFTLQEAGPEFDVSVQRKVWRT